MDFVWYGWNQEIYFFRRKSTISVRRKGDKRKKKQREEEIGTSQSLGNKKARGQEYMCPIPPPHYHRHATITYAQRRHPVDYQCLASPRHRIPPLHFYSPPHVPSLLLLFLLFPSSFQFFFFFHRISFWIWPNETVGGQAKSSRKVEWRVWGWRLDLMPGGVFLNAEWDEWDWWDWARGQARNGACFSAVFVKGLLWCKFCNTAESWA